VPVGLDAILAVTSPSFQPTEFDPERVFLVQSGKAKLVDDAVQLE
jgi:hypothetical protein